MSLSMNQVRFFRLLESSPYLRCFFCSKSRAYDPDGINEFLSSASHGQVVMTKFFVSLWKNQNEMSFDLFEAANALDSSNRRIIAGWLLDPFWP